MMLEKQDVMGHKEHSKNGRQEIEVDGWLMFYCRMRAGYIMFALEYQWCDSR